MTHDSEVAFLSPGRATRFWLAALGGYNYPGSPLDLPPGSPPTGFATWEDWGDAQGIPEDQRYRVRTIIDTEGDRPDIFFIAVPEEKVAKNRVHLDIRASLGAPEGEGEQRQDAEAERLVTLGATVIERVNGHLVLQDVEGNEFCIT